MFTSRRIFLASFHPMVLPLIIPLRSRAIDGLEEKGPRARIFSDLPMKPKVDILTWRSAGNSSKNDYCILKCEV